MRIYFHNMVPHLFSLLLLHHQLPKESNLMQIKPKQKLPAAGVRKEFIPPLVT